MGHGARGNTDPGLWFPLRGGKARSSTRQGHRSPYQAPVQITWQVRDGAQAGFSPQMPCPPSCGRTAQPYPGPDSQASCGLKQRQGRPCGLCDHLLPAESEWIKTVPGDGHLCYLKAPRYKPWLKSLQSGSHLLERAHVLRYRIWGSPRDRVLEFLLAII